MNDHQTAAEPFCHVAHPLLNKSVTDTSTRQSGTLMAVVRENAARPGFPDRPALVAYIRGADYTEWSTLLENVAAGRVCCVCQHLILGPAYQTIVPFSASGARPNHYAHHRGDPECDPAAE
ncbi:hypothetical protein [Streptomyces sp. NPDC089799]|uniref:hypothetical protein n=1 Tax=Streptomyces sp. NPDC089799 TaxID=3155066 RepID=UPI00342FC781